VKLKRNTEPTNGQLIQKAVDEYNGVLRTKPTGTRVGNWIKQWEYAMTKGERYGIPQLMNGQWLRDLATAIRPLSDVLYNKYVTLLLAIILYKVERIETRCHTAAKGQAHNRSKRRRLLPKGRVPYNTRRVDMLFPAVGIFLRTRGLKESHFQHPG
jgi:hypothetical protein